MATKEARELRELDTPDLEQRLSDAQNELMAARFGLATHQTANTARLGNAKRQIARIKTILTERQEEG